MKRRYTFDVVVFNRTSETRVQMPLYRWRWVALLHRGAYLFGPYLPGYAVAPSEVREVLA